MTPRTAEILRRRAAGASCRQIAIAYGITRSRVWQIVTRESRRAQHPLAALSTRARHALASPHGPYWSRGLLFPPITSPDQLAAATFDLDTLRRIPGCGLKTAREILHARAALLISGSSPPA